MKFPKEYNLKVDVTKVNWEIMKEWTAQRVSQLLGMEDEVLIGYIHEQLGADKKVIIAFCQMSSKFSLPVKTCMACYVVQTAYLIMAMQDLDPKRLQIALTGFLEKNTSLFVKVNLFCTVQQQSLDLTAALPDEPEPCATAQFHCLQQSSLLAHGMQYCPDMSHGTWFKA